MPTPAPITPVTAGEALNSGVAIVQMLGLIGFIMFGYILWAARGILGAFLKRGR